MDRFKSAIAVELEEYLSIRQMVLTKGTCEIDRNVLGDFDCYLAEHGSGDKAVAEDLINGWIAHLRIKNHSRTVSNKVSNLRCLLKYLRYCGIPVFMPECPKFHDDYVPYIFTETEMGELIRHADKAADNGNIFDIVVAMLIRLLYGCGLRHGESLTLIRSDADFMRGTLLLRQPKNKKQRIVPMHKSLADMLMQYCAAIEIIDKPDAFLFPGKKQNSHISMTTVGSRFRLILKSAGLYIPTEKPDQRGQCIHCLRHVFAVGSFAQAERNGRTTVESVPYLSVYLGHFDMDGTEKYLKFSSDIFPEHTEMFEAYSNGVFTVLGGAG